MPDYLVSGSIVTFNSTATIEATLRTLREQTHGVPFHLYVIDNSSRDGTANFVQNVDPDAEIVHIPWNVGFGAGHNLILSRLTSKYHAIINPDIILTEDAISIMSNYMDEHPDIVMLSPRIVFPGTQENQILGKRNPTLRYLIASRLRGNPYFDKILSKYAMLDQDFSKPFPIQNATGCFMFVRTDILQKIGGFDERFFLYFEDCDLTRSLTKLGKVLYFPLTTVEHIWHRESKKNFRLMCIQIQSMLKYFWKWRRFFPHSSRKEVSKCSPKN